jgi:predicted nucleic acid-binding protein
VIALDSSVWIEMWRSDDVRQQVRREIERRQGDPARIVVPATVAYETHRWLIRSYDDEDVIDSIAGSMDRHDHVAIDSTLARRAAVTSVTTGLAAADATILAAARSRHAHLLTFDSDFEGIPDVTVLPRGAGR